MATLHSFAVTGPRTENHAQRVRNPENVGLEEAQREFSACANVIAIVPAGPASCPPEEHRREAKSEQACRFRFGHGRGFERGTEDGLVEGGQWRGKPAVRRPLYSAVFCDLGYGGERCTGLGHRHVCEKYVAKHIDARGQRYRSETVE
jgi:hypothetical protein